MLFNFKDLRSFDHIHGLKICSLYSLVRTTENLYAYKKYKYFILINLHFSRSCETEGEFLNNAIILLTFFSNIISHLGKAWPGKKYILFSKIISSILYMVMKCTKLYANSCFQTQNTFSLEHLLE